MEENTNNAGYEDFFGAFEGDDGYQTDTAEETEATEEVTEADGEAQNEPESGDNTEEEHTSESEEEGAGEGEEDAEESSEQMFTIKVNKAERQIGLAEMTELAQKGADYDRVKGQLESARQAEQNLQAQLEEQQGYVSTLKLISEQVGVEPDQLLEQLHINSLKGKGMTEAEAKAEIRAAKAEAQLKSVHDQQTQKQAAADSNTERAQREVADFRKNFPEVELTEKLCNELMSDVQAGMSLTNAYLKRENARQAAEIAELQQKQAAAVQNKRNRSKTPGSQRDSGGQRTKDAYDDFFDAFEK